MTTKYKELAVIEMDASDRSSAVYAQFGVKSLPAFVVYNAKGRRAYADPEKEREYVFRLLPMNSPTQQ